MRIYDYQNRPVAEKNLLLANMVSVHVTLAERGYSSVVFAHSENSRHIMLNQLEKALVKRKLPYSYPISKQVLTHGLADIHVLTSAYALGCPHVPFVMAVGVKYMDPKALQEIPCVPAATAHGHPPRLVYI